jgi:type IV pilus assembly protein PilW
MHRLRSSGFSLVELLVAMVIGLIGSIIIFQVYAGFENQKRATTSSGDAATNMAAATNALEQAGRDAGYGLNFTALMGCDAIGWIKDATPPPPSPPAPPPPPPTPGVPYVAKLTPINITRDATGATLTFVRNSSDASYAVTTLKTDMADPEDDLELTNLYGIKEGDVLVIAQKKDEGDAVKDKKITCAITQATSAGVVAGRNIVTHKYGINGTDGAFPSTDPMIAGPLYTYWNKLGGLGTLSAANISTLNASLDSPIGDPVSRFTFKAGAYVMNMGPQKGATSLGLQTTIFKVSNGTLLASGAPVVDGVVFMDAQYGIAANTGATTVTYASTLPSTASTDPKIAQKDWFSLRTVRVVLIAKASQYDKDFQLCAQPAAPAAAVACPLTAAHGMPAWTNYTAPASDIHYRHKAVELIIPLRNMFWTPQ